MFREPDGVHERMILIDPNSLLGKDLKLIVDAKTELPLYDPLSFTAQDIQARLDILTQEVQLDPGIVVQYFGPDLISSLPPFLGALNLDE